MALPTEKSIPVFAFTRHGQTIPLAVETTNSNDFIVGDLVRYVDTKNKTTGYFQNESLILTVEHTPVDYTDAADLKYMGVVTQNEPINHTLFQDVKGDLELDDRSMNLDTLAGPQKNLSVLISHDVIAVKFWDVVNDQLASLDDTDVWSDVYVSKTDGGSGHTGKAGYATVDDQSGVSGIVVIGKLLGVPINDSFWGYVLHNPDDVRG